MPDASTILRFRHLLEAHQLTAWMFAAVRTLLEEKRLLLKASTIVDATISPAPSSTKNATGTHDPAVHQSRKGKRWYSEMKVHVSTVTQGLVHSITTTDAAQADITQLPGQETTLYRDKASYKADDKLNWECSGGTNRVNTNGKRSAKWDTIKGARSRLRARGEHVVRVVTCSWGFTKVLYRGG